MVERDGDVLSGTGGARGARWRRRSRTIEWALCFVLVLSAPRIRAEQDDAVILPTVTPLFDCAECPALHRPAAADGPLVGWAQLVDVVAHESVQDLGFHPVGPPSDSQGGGLTETALVPLAKSQWVFAPRLEAKDSRLVLRILAVPAGSEVVLSRTERISPRDVEVRVALMMHDLVNAGRKRVPDVTAERAPTDTRNVAKAARSPGRAILALNGAALGGYFGFALQHAGGSDDARLTYPLIALGTGIGLGSSMIVADEWDVGTGDAWYVSAGTLWPALGVFLIAEESDERYLHAYALAAGIGGLAASTAALSFGPMSDGGAVLAHSGGAYGSILGGLGELIVDGSTSSAPRRGLGIGAISGVVTAGAAARLLPTPSPSRLLLIDLGLGLGGLTGAAVASPFLFGDTEDPLRTRLWLGSVAFGVAAGGVLAYFLTDSSEGEDEERAQTAWWPRAGIIGLDGSSPVVGAGVQGVF